MNKASCALLAARNLNLLDRVLILRNHTVGLYFFCFCLKSIEVGSLRFLDSNL